MPYTNIYRGILVQYPSHKSKATYHKYLHNLNKINSMQFSKKYPKFWPSTDSYSIPKSYSAPTVYREKLPDACFSSQ